MQNIKLQAGEPNRLAFFYPTVRRNIAPTLDLKFGCSADEVIKKKLIIDMRPFDFHPKLLSKLICPARMILAELSGLPHQMELCLTSQDPVHRAVRGEFSVLFHTHTHGLVFPLGHRRSSL